MTDLVVGHWTVQDIVMIAVLGLKCRRTVEEKSSITTMYQKNEMIMDFTKVSRQCMLLPCDVR